MARQSKRFVARRGKNLTDEAVEQIVMVLDGWSGKLTWEALIDAIVLRLHCRYTRQALFKHERIKAAYALRKSALRESGRDEGTPVSGALGDAWVRIARLEAENQRLESENQRLLEQFVVWAYNAHTRGLGEDFLSQPLPRVNREQTLPQKTEKTTQRKR